MTDTHARHVLPTLLVVDDEPPVIEIVARMLAPMGCEMLTATSGADALEICGQRGQPIDLLLTDLHMPSMSGRVLAAKLRKMQPGLKVLYMTGRSDELFGPLTELGPLEAFIEKPVTPTGICEAVSLHLFGTLAPPRAPRLGARPSNA